MSKFIVLKFGGSSQCIEGMNVMLTKIKEYLNDDYKIFIVVSAVGKTTNDLYDIVNFNKSKYDVIKNNHLELYNSINTNININKTNINTNKINALLDNLLIDIDKYSMDPFCDHTQQKIKIISYGEFLSSNIVHDFLNNNDIQNCLLNAHHFIKNKSSSNAICGETLNIKGEFYCDETKLKQMLLPDVNVYVVQGFIASTCDNGWCILTRSGSNTSAALVANALNAKRLEIWTDVSGLYTADPRKVPNAKVIPKITSRICQEAAAFGAKVLHPYSIKPCADKNIHIHIKNTFDPNGTFTIIGINQYDDMPIIENFPILTCQTNISRFKITSIDMWEGIGFLYDIFEKFKDNGVEVDIVNTSQFSVVVTTKEKCKAKLVAVRDKLVKKYKVKFEAGLAMVSIVSDGIKEDKNINDIHFNIINKMPTIRMSYFGCNNMSISYIIDEWDVDELTCELHDMLYC